MFKKVKKRISRRQGNRSPKGDESTDEGSTIKVDPITEEKEEDDSVMTEGTPLMSERQTAKQQMEK
jgi:hypothetical protein